MRQKLRKTVCMSLVGVMTFTSVWSSDMTIQAASKPKKITMNKKNVSLEVGKTFKLKVKKVKPKKASKAVTYKTNKKKVATVSKKGVIKAKSAGTATITVTSKKSKKLKVRVKVNVKNKQVHPPITSNAPAASNSPAQSAAPGASSNPAQSMAPGASSNPAQSAAPGESTVPGTSAAPGESTVPGTSAAPDASSNPTQSTAPGESSKPVQSTAPGESSKPAQSTAPTPTPVPTVKPTFAPSTQSYEYFNDYTLGWSDKEKCIVAYKDGKEVTLAEAGAELYNKKTDNIFAQHIANNNWYDDKILLTPPIQYTTSDGKAHNVDSMLTNFDFIADPTCIDNSKNDGKLYVYGTTEGIDYEAGALAKNGYNNHSLTILSTKDMVNWTDEGTLDNENLTNEISTKSSKEKTKCKWGTKAWAPSGLKIDGDGDGEDEYYIFYTNGGAVGYVQGDSPTGPWKDDLGKVLFNQSTPNCSDVVWCFDPAVLVDDKGDAYVYFGGGVPGDKNPTAAQKAHPQTSRVAKIKFEKGTGKVLLDGEPKKLDAYYMFEDSEINQFHGKYFYSYCINFMVPGSLKPTGAINKLGSGQIGCYVSKDPMNITFDPDKQESTDDLKYLGAILDNPSAIYGESYNNHHHMQSFKGHDYIFYHSTILGNTLFRDNKQYRNLHVDEISVDEATDAITITPSYEGASQIEDFEPYKNEDGSAKYINATTAASSAGVKSSRDDAMVLQTINGSPMVLDAIDTGDWTCIKGVNFGENGLKNFGMEYFSASDAGRVELFIDDPTKIENKAATIDILETTNNKYVYKSVATTKMVTGKHDVYFVFRGSGYKVASWAFSENAEAGAPDISGRPDVPTPTPVPTPNPNIKTGWNEDKTEYSLKIDETTVKADGGASIEFNEAEGSVTIAYNPQYPGAWFNFPDEAIGKFSSIEFTYKDATEGGFGSAVRYTTSNNTDEEINWGGLFPAGEGLQTQTIELKAPDKDFSKYKIFRNDCEDCYLTVTAVVLKK